MIKLIKLVNGEELVGDVSCSDTSSILVKNVYTVMYRFHPYSTNPTVKLVPYMMFGVNEFHQFKFEDIVNTTDARKAFSDYYEVVVEMNKEKNQSQLIDNELNIAVSLIKNNSKEEIYNSILENFEKPDNIN